MIVKKVTDILNEKVAKELELPEELVFIVLQHQWKALRASLDLNKTVEISKLATFNIRPKKVLKNLKKFNSILEAYKQRDLTPTLQKKIDSVQENITYLNTKL